MKMLALTILAFAMPLVAHAQADAAKPKTAAATAANVCLDCRAKVSAEAQRCDTGAKTSEEKAACSKQFTAANAACNCPPAPAPAPAPASTAK